MDAATRLEFRQELRRQIHDPGTLARFRGYALDIVADARSSRTDDERHDPAIIDVDTDELNAYLEHLAERMAPELARWVAGWIITNMESIDEWRGFGPDVRRQDGSPAHANGPSPRTRRGGS